MIKKEKESPLWWTVVKLVMLAVALIGGTGLALWYVAQHQSLSMPDPAKAPVTPSSSWGIVHDSPIAPKR